jgi:hypothetical protein
MSCARLPIVKRLHDPGPLIFAVENFSLCPLDTPHIRVLSLRGTGSIGEKVAAIGWFGVDINVSGVIISEVLVVQYTERKVAINLRLRLLQPRASLLIAS